MKSYFSLFGRPPRQKKTIFSLYNFFLLLAVSMWTALDRSERKKKKEKPEDSMDCCDRSVSGSSGMARALSSHWHQSHFYALSPRPGPPAHRLKFSHLARTHNRTTIKGSRVKKDAASLSCSCSPKKFYKVISSVAKATDSDRPRVFPSFHLSPALFS